MRKGTERSPLRDMRKTFTLLARLFVRLRRCGFGYVVRRCALSHTLKTERKFRAVWVLFFRAGPWAPHMTDEDTAVRGRKLSRGATRGPTLVRPLEIRRISRAEGRFSVAMNRGE
jgi:hypothetical protein